MTKTETPLNLQLLGGEMLVWSDRDPDHGRSPAHGGALAALLELAVPVGGRVLVAGPHGDDLIDLLVARGGELTYLVRSYPDAHLLAARYQDRSTVSVLCGGLEKLVDRPGFDVIVALDDLGRLTSTEEADLSWAEAYDRLLATLGPNGTLVLGTENLLGLHRLVDLLPTYADRHDGAWSPVGEFDPSRPGGLERLTAHLRGSDLEVVGAYAAYPTPEAPSVLLTQEAVQGDAALHGYLDGTLAAACRSGFSGRAVLTDPRRLASTALRNAAAVDLAPMWVLLARRPGGAEPQRLPSILVMDGEPDDPWRLGYEINQDRSGQWVRASWPASTAQMPVMASAVDGSPSVLTREAARLGTALVAGRTLEEHLITLSLRRDLARLRELLTTYRGWLAKHERDGTLPSQLVFATVENVLVGADGELVLLDPSWESTLPVSAEVALVRALRRFAVELLVGGYVHPWPTTLDANSLTVILAAMAELDVDRTVLDQAIAIEVELAAARRGLDRHERRRLGQELAAVATGLPSLDVCGYRELRGANQRIAEELAAARAKLVWYEEMLTSRENALRRAQRNIRMLNGSLSFRIGRVLMTPARLVKRGLRRAARRMRAVSR